MTNCLESFDTLMIAANRFDSNLFGDAVFSGNAFSDAVFSGNVFGSVVAVCLFQCTVLLTIVLVLHRIFRGRSASFRHGVLSLGLFVLPVSLAMQWFAPVVSVPVKMPAGLLSNRSIDDSRAPASDSVSQGTIASDLAARSLAADTGATSSAALDGVPATAVQWNGPRNTAAIRPQTSRTDLVVGLSDQRGGVLDGGGTVGETSSVILPPADQASSEKRVVDGLSAAGDGKSSVLFWLGRCLLVVWLLGSLVCIVRLVMSYWHARRRLARSSDVDDVMRADLFGKVPRLESAKVNIRVAKECGQMPICLGFLRPTIILPRHFATWSPAQLKSVLNHELAHAVRGDTWINLIAQMQNVVLWFHPINMIVNSRRRRDCEIACDDWALQQGIGRRDYARALLDVASRFRARDLSLCHPMAARSSALDKRIQSILEGSVPRSIITVRERAVLMVAFLFACLAVCSVWVDVSDAAAPVDKRSSTNRVVENASTPIQANSTNQTKRSEADTAGRPSNPPAAGATSTPTLVKAVNLGNWLLLEPWLLDITDEDIPDQASIYRILDDRFGPQQRESLLATYRKNWISLADLNAAGQLGFNAVRLPFDCGLLESGDRPGVLRERAFAWLDHAVDLCEKAGLSVILDLHGAPGGQSLDGPSGDANSNRLWTDPDARDRTVWLWKEIAKHYRDHESVIAYDVINEPFGDFGQDLRQPMLALFSRLYDSIRTVDSQTLIYAPATLDGFAFYGNPKDRGWKNVGFTQHAYPGLFDGRPVAVRSHDMFLKHWVGPVDRLVDKLDVPFLLGEYNVVFEDAGGAALTAWYAQEYQRRQWSTAIWTLKRLLKEPSPDVNSWSLLTNERSITIDLRRDSYDQLVDAFEKIGKTTWRADEKFSQALKGEADKWQWTGRDPWRALEIETDVAGSSIVRGGNWVIEAAGRDIFGKRDRFHFRCRPAEGDFHAAGRVLWIDETSPWAKAGWMIRENYSADAAHIMLHTTPDGKVILCGRDKAGQDSWQETVGVGGLPVRLGVKRHGDDVQFAWTDASGRPMQKTVSPAFLSKTEAPLFGLAVCSLAPGIQTTAGLDQVIFRSLRSDGSEANFASWQTKPTTLVSSPVAEDRDTSGWQNVGLENSSFETKGDSDDQAAGWNRWGNWVNRETAWTPVDDGDAIIGYHHYRIDSGADSGLWQNTKVTSNQETRFRIRANADIPASGQFADSVELRIEVPGQDGTPMTVASKIYPASDITTGDQWSTLEVIGTPNSSVIRLIVCIKPAAGDGVKRDGSLKFDTAELQQRAGQSADPAAVTRSTTPSNSIDPGNSSDSIGRGPSLKNGSFEQSDGGGLAAWSNWGSWFGRQDQWTPVRTGDAIVAYEHFQTSGNDTAGIWQDIEVPVGAQIKFAIHANVDAGQPGNRAPGKVELKLESPAANGKTITLATKQFEANHLASGDTWSNLSVEATSLGNQVRCLIIVHPNQEDGQRDGALKIDDASITAVLE